MEVFSKKVICCRTPKTLQCLAAEIQAQALLIASIPSSWKNSYYKEPFNVHNGYKVFPLLSNLIDPVICSAKEFDEPYAKKQELIKCIVDVKQWWENTGIHSGSSNHGKLVVDAFNDILLHFDAFAHNPLLNLVFQLVFCKTAGRFHRFYEVKLEVPHQKCKGFSAFLESLAPFHITEYINDGIYFGTSEPVIVILQNSPCLKKLIIHHDICKVVFETIGTYCSNLEALSILNKFYRMKQHETFVFTDMLFRGKQIARLPKIKYLDLCEFSDLNELICNVIYNYPNILSVFSYPLDTVVRKQNCVYLGKLIDLCIQYDDIYYICPQLLYCFSNVKHLSLNFDLDLDLSEYNVKKCADFLSNLQIISISLYFPFVNYSRNTWEWWLPHMSFIGTKLKFLQIYVKFDSSSGLNSFRKVLNSAPNLEFLGLHFDSSTSICEDQDTVQLIVFQKLKNLHCKYENSDDCALFAYLVKDLVHSSPSLKNFELKMNVVAMNIFLDVLSLNKLCNIEMLSIKFADFFRRMDVDFFVSVIEALPLLKILYVWDVSPVVYSFMKTLYANSQLTVQYTDKDQISFSCFGDKGYQSL